MIKKAFVFLLLLSSIGYFTFTNDGNRVFDKISGLQSQNWAQQQHQQQISPKPLANFYDIHEAEDIKKGPNRDLMEKDGYYYEKTAATSLKPKSLEQRQEEDQEISRVYSGLDIPKTGSAIRSQSRSKFKFKTFRQQKAPVARSIFSYRSLLTRSPGRNNVIHYAIEKTVERLQQELGHGASMEDQPEVKSLEQIHLNPNIKHTLVKGADADRIFHVGEDLPSRVVRPILIATTWRSGSSFFGDLLTHYPGTFYSFEPFHYDTQQEKTKFLADLFKCQFEQAYFKHVSKHPFLFNSHNHRLSRVCQNLLPMKQACYLSQIVQPLCQKFPIRLAKTVRVRVNETERFILDPDLPNFKVIVLVRDPRGVMNSRANMEWCVRDACADLATVCKDLQRDTESARLLQKKYPEKVHLIRYEDLSSEPFHVVDELLRFLDLPKSKDIESYIEKHTKTSRVQVSQKVMKDYSGPYSTHRDSAATAFAWRKKLDFNYIKHIQNTCQAPMGMLGYRSFKNINERNNMTISPLLKSRDQIWDSIL